MTYCPEIHTKVIRTGFNTEMCGILMWTPYTRFYIREWATWTSAIYGGHASNMLLNKWFDIGPVICVKAVVFVCFVTANTETCMSHTLTYKIIWNYKLNSCWTYSNAMNLSKPHQEPAIRIYKVYSVFKINVLLWLYVWLWLL